MKARVWKFAGEITALNQERKTISLWVNGRGHGDELPIAATMLAWLQQPGVAFVASIPWEQRSETDLLKIEWLAFEPLPYSDLSEDELVALIFKERRKT